MLPMTNYSILSSLQVSKYVSRFLKRQNQEVEYEAKVYYDAAYALHEL